MSSTNETKKPNGAAEPAAEAQSAPADTAPAAEPNAEDTAPKADKDAKPEKEKKDWFGKKNRELEAAQAKLEAAEAKNKELKDQLLRTAAEYDNYRKRTAREADMKFNDGVSHAVTQILAILDTLDMAANADCTDENYKKGVVMTLDKAAKALDTLHIVEIEALGKPFDPQFMNAVQQVPPEEGQESGTVVRVFQKGYKIGDKIIRHATVVVAE
ncbi:nucleotide exchange factor GrpE [Gemmiger formicilis]|uniref:nucleotide exchange factor GrpE n=1 Tax=Gemmiger formicilis TaxID=745368 RepID=UPI00195C5851|nr:nucleotide exchange factor GrpE [Gemmiger formicilis]MBM6716955.1 nucleotide exchange factor GrpE [Gemmiger formicilis]